MRQEIWQAITHGKYKHLCPEKNNCRILYDSEKKICYELDPLNPKKMLLKFCPYCGQRLVDEDNNIIMSDNEGS